MAALINCSISSFTQLRLPSKWNVQIAVCHPREILSKELFLVNYNFLDPEREKMNSTYSKFPYTLAIIFGLIVPFIPEMEPFPVPIALIFLFGGGIFGFLWPKESWHWGLWIAGPMFFLLGLSVLFAGQLDIFLKKDLPIMLLAIICACLGSFVLAKFKSRR